MFFFILTSIFYNYAIHYHIIIIIIIIIVNPLEFRGNYNATSHNMKLVHWPLMGGLLHLVQRGEEWAGPEPINGQCTSPYNAFTFNECLKG